MNNLLYFAALSIFAFAQVEIPFESKNVEVQLIITNGSAIEAGEIMVNAVNVPNWVQFNTTMFSFSSLQPGEQRKASFTFSLNKFAPINSVQKLYFKTSNVNNESWIKEVSIKILPPGKYEVYQNYPNPFNPSTTISYQIPSNGLVSVRIFDVLGKEIFKLKDEIQNAGYHEVFWNGSNRASGMYIYQVTFENLKGEKQFHRKKMILTK